MVDGEGYRADSCVAGEAELRVVCRSRGPKRGAPGQSVEQLA